MPYEVKPLPELLAIEITLASRLTIEDLRLVASEVLFLAAQTGFRRALVDCRDYLGGAGLGQVSFLTAQVSNRPVSDRGIEAFITPADPDAAADVQFYVRVANYLGTRVRVFATREDAIQWLTTLQQDEVRTGDNRSGGT
ncbi:MAG TPA: hypothetical protein VET46_15285 [Steroidobacteraceae bacterium]|nr:hypothetical protein [Steroidobacteraceae bacterium]